MLEFLDFGRTEFEILFHIFSHIFRGLKSFIFYPGNARTLKLRQKGQMVLLGENSARGVLYKGVSGKYWAKNGRDRLGFQKISKKCVKKWLLLSQYYSDLDENLSTHPYWTAEQHCRPLPNWPEHLRNSYGLSKLKKTIKTQQWTQKFRFWPSRKNSEKRHLEKVLRIWF